MVQLSPAVVVIGEALETVEATLAAAIADINAAAGSDVATVGLFVRDVRAVTLGLQRARDGIGELRTLLAYVRTIDAAPSAPGAAVV